MKPNPLHFYCVVDRRASRSRERLELFKEEMNRLYPCEFTIELFDGEDVEWEMRNNKYYAKDDFVFEYTKRIYAEHGKKIDAVKFFVDNRNWKQGPVRLRGFKLGRIFNTLYVTFTRFRKDYEGTAEHELLHFVDEYIKANTGVSLEAVFGVKDFDEDIVHRANYSDGYDYDDIWAKIADHVSNAVYARRQETATNKVLMMKQYIKLLLQLINLLQYKSHSIPEIEIRKMHTTKCYERYGMTAMVGHIDLGTEAGTIDEILNGTRSASYNYYIPRHAKYIIEFVPFEKSAWHAGVIHDPQPELGELVGGADKIIQSGEPNRYTGGVCYEGRTVNTAPTQGQIDLAHELMLYKKKANLPWVAHWQITSYKPRIVSKFVDGVNALLGNK
jgi:hypothetical protein